MSKIYIVQSSQGEWEDYSCWVEKAFVSKEKALEYAKSLDNSRENAPQFITTEFIEAYQECLLNAPIPPKFNDFPITKENSKAYYKFQLDNFKQEREYLKSAMYEKGFLVTDNMLNDYDDWEDNSFNKWNPCIVVEIELCDDI